MEVYISDRALHSMQCIYDHFYQWAAYRSAEHILNVIEKGYKQLALFPYMGPVESTLQEENKHYRSFVIHPHYKIIYVITKDHIYILDIWDCRQDNQRIKKIMDNSID